MPQTEIIRTCPFCKKTNTLHVDVDAYSRWQNGMLVQNAFPDLSANDREMIITGICCWDEAFKEIDQ